MNKREIYRNKLEEHYTAFEVSPSPRYVGMFCHESAYLDSDAQKELRKDVKERIKEEKHCKLANTNGKATFYYNEDGECVLRSYYTDVAKIKDGYFTKLWEGYSVTTMNHINAFLALNGQSISKYDWVMLETGVPTRL